MSGFASAAQVELLVGGAVHRGWRAMKLTASLDAPATKASLELAERWSAAADGIARAVKPGEACQLRLEGETVLDGWIDAVEVRYDERDHVLTVVARDRIGDLVDCAAVLDGPHEWSGLKLDEIARRLGEPYGVRVEALVDPGAPFARFAIQPGETAWEALERAARARGVLLAGDGSGTLRLTRASEAAEGAGPIELGANVRRALGRFDHAERYSVVCVRGQGEGGGQSAGVHAPDGAVTAGGEQLLRARGEARATDPAIRRHRPRVVIAEAAGDATGFAQRAAWEVRHAAGQGTRVAYTVPGWRGPEGALWRTATRVRVRDAWLGVDADLLVATVLFSLTPGDGSLTEVEVTLPDAYDVQAQPLKDERARRGGAGPETGLFDVTDPDRPQRLPVPAP